MEKRNLVFIGASLDGYIADRNGGLNWLTAIPNPEQSDMGYTEFMAQVDALVMGRKTFETVCGFEGDWPYAKPIFIVSRTFDTIAEEYRDKAELVKGSLVQILEKIHNKGYHRLYIDGGVTIQNFLKEDLIDEITITTIPIVLGGGSALFSVLPKELEFTLVASKVFLDQLVQNHYIRKG
ncbi:5-amino-6-(5-phosphoribosylamino)uracil reductase [Arenibacter sp. NBRC 103722]|uniref:5-amino-6-(5-phosphoribosylamino)uracil reductase n=1 Tax=Arenibacter algicola TaxID=616991 RepID=A0A221UZ16_9FLAO|nr:MULTISPECIES: dihydrofolate reductase family protein [Arenibacter]ASO06605.1 5-amino-6-(5-phosphoribosylamino)uracil reductase [Arenibacter algicola]GBF20128.1 5-amino-6-(5-phosphoribosylamino)uracil reductase [Arenibacter sp. NBRC 103722]